MSAEPPEFETLEHPVSGPRKPGGPPVWPIVVAFALLAAAVGLYFGLYRGRAGDADAKPAAESAPAPAAPAVPAPEPAAAALPALDDSDSLVRRLVRGLSSHPAIASWLVTDDLVRRLTAAVANVAEGVSPRAHVAFLAPERRFAARAAGGRTLVEPASYARYDLLADAVASLDAGGVAELYRRLEPLFDAAYRDLGYPGGDFDRALAAALRRLLATPAVVGEIELVPGVESYEFADPGLEALTPPQKALIRMGPENAARIRAKLREVGLALGYLPEELG